MITNEQKKNKWKNLPNKIKEVMTDFNTVEILEKTAQKYNLRIDQAGELMDEVGLTFLGFTAPNQFLPNIKNRLKIDDQKAVAIMREIDNLIFSKIKSELISKTNETKNVPPKIEINVPKPPQNEKVELKTETKTEPKLPEFFETNVNLSSNQKENWQASVDREEILKEIENPSATDFKTENESPEKNKVPNNLPSEFKPKEKDFSPPILRTMQKDMAEKDNDKTGGGDELPIKRENIIVQSEDNQKIPEIPKPPMKNDGVPNHTNNIPKDIETPLSQKSQNPIVPQPTQKIENLMQNKMEPTQPDQSTPIKPIRIPSEKKSYTVDPYREAIE